MRFALAFLVFILNSCVHAQSDSTGRIRGLVMDHASGEVLPNTIVKIDPLQLAVITDENGLYTLDQIPPGTYDIITRLMGYESDTIRNIPVATNEIRQLNITLTPLHLHDSAWIDPPVPELRSVQPVPIICPAGFNKRRGIIVGSTQAALVAGSLIGLHQLWYKQYPRESFHTFNDAGEWNQMDKVGHFQSSYTIAQISTYLWNQTYMNRKRAVWIGGLTSFGYLTAIEIMDGYSSGWGFSTADMLANTAGCALFVSQELYWGRQRISPKFGFSPSPYAGLRPDLLGKNFAEQLLKDYNGQTYWLSVNVASFLSEETKFPRWLNIAVGYGANGMTGGHENPVMYNSAGNEITLNRYRQYYLSLDIDLRRIKTNSRFLGVLFNTFAFIKIPAPAIEVNKFGIRGYILKF